MESCCGNEWVFFNAGQVLPCYVIKVQKCDPRKPQPPPLQSLLVTSDSGSDGTVRDKKAALLARVSYVHVRMYSTRALAIYTVV